jgi:uncharacterized membrane protein
VHGCSFEKFLGMNGWVEIVFCLAATALAVYLGWRIYRIKKGSFDRRDSLAILQRRLAAGEIKVEEFNLLKKML